MPFSVNCTEFFGSIFVRAIFNQLILRIFHLLHRKIMHRNTLIISVMVESKHFPKLSTKCFVLHCESGDYINSLCYQQNCKKSILSLVCAPNIRGAYSFVPFMSLGHFGGQKRPFSRHKTQEYKNLRLKNYGDIQQIDGDICI